jgi:hypothetical protein
VKRQIQPQLRTKGGEGLRGRHLAKDRFCQIARQHFHAKGYQQGDYEQSYEGKAQSLQDQRT